jgi:peptidoglycan/LPS O-acetylase OafA/YrhL
MQRLAHGNGVFTVPMSIVPEKSSEVTRQSSPSEYSAAVPVLGKRDVSSGSVHLDALRGAPGQEEAAVFSQETATGSARPIEAGPDLAMQEAAGSPLVFGAVHFASEAVILFFVLSGYLVGGSVLRLMKAARWSWRVYLTKRLTRLYVVLIPALVIGCSLDYFGSKVFGSGSVYGSPRGIQIITTYSLAERFTPSVFLGDLLFLDNFKVPYIGTNVALWSLSNEFWYYIIFPMLCVALLWGKTPLRRVLSLFAALALMMFTGRDMNLLFPIWIIGALVSIAPRRLTAAHAKRMSMLTGVLLVAVMVAVRMLRWPALEADYLIALVTAALLYFLAQQTDRAKSGIYKTLSSFFSRISYTLYLFHVPLAVLFCALLNNPWHEWSKSPEHLGVFVLSDCVLVAFAYLLWKLFESRTDEIRNWLFRVEGDAYRHTR